MNKRVLTLTLSGILIFIIFISFIPNKNEKDDSYDTNKITFAENPSSNINENTPGVKEEKYTVDDLENTKKMALEFSKSIYSIESTDPLKYLGDITNYTTKPLGERILQIAKEDLKEVYKRIVTAVNIIEPKYEEEDKSLLWSLELMSNIYNEKGELVGEEKAAFFVVFMKEGSDYKISEYSLTKYPKNNGN
ncbi:hypothetical protein [Clostridium sp. LP20]|uniref:hypothetical protein n=1 Tax=Clostridium sp. LP20 TaxID=3418665 RepID=UPI003EE6A2BD